MFRPWVVLHYGFQDNNITTMDLAASHTIENGILNVVTLDNVTARARVRYKYVPPKEISIHSQKLCIASSASHTLVN